MLGINEIKKITANDIKLEDDSDKTTILLSFELKEIAEHFIPILKEHEEYEGKITKTEDAYHYSVFVEHWTDVNEIHYFLDTDEMWIEVSEDLKCDYLDNLILEVSENHIATH